MRNIAEKIFAFVKDEEGLTMVEYAVAGGLITAGAVVAFQTLGDNVNSAIEAINQAFVDGGVPGATN